MILKEKQVFLYFIELLEFPENKFIVYEPNLVSSSQITSGLAFPALFYLMLKNYDLTSWAAFIDRFSYPTPQVYRRIRLGNRKHPCRFYTNHIL